MATASHSTTQSSKKSTSVPPSPLGSQPSTLSSVPESRFSIKTVQFDSDTNFSDGEDNVVMSKLLHRKHRLHSPERYSIPPIHPS
uniref:Uncharacterized protein n=1 Tax=Cucumis melo TaxID=3656 RepID=A0A9I9D8Z2_CUCME